MYEKMRFYLLLLAILWSGVLVDGIAGAVKESGRITAIEAIQNTGNKSETQILHQREVKGKMALLEMELEAGDLLTSYGGEMVKSLQSENFYCFYGYTNRIDNYVLTDHERVNLNLVITYNEENDVTQIIWATPFLNEDF